MTGLKSGLLAKVRAGEPTGDARRDALVRFVRTLTQTSGTVAAEELGAIKNAAYTDAQVVDICLAIAVTVFTNVFNRINDTALDFPRVSKLVTMRSPAGGTPLAQLTKLRCLACALPAAIAPASPPCGA